MNKNKGITLIALIVTIIILLILAGVAISALSGENGLIAKTKLAKEKYEISEAKEELELKITELIIEQQGKGKNLEKDDLTKLNSEELEVKSTETFPVEIVYKGYVFNVDENFTVTYIGKADGTIVTYTTEPEGYVKEGSVWIKFKITNSNGISKIQNPNGIENNCNGKTSVGIDYEVTANGTYTFKIIDVNGNETVKDIIVDKIDTEKPKEFIATIEDITKDSLKIIAKTEDGDATDTSVKSGIQKYEYYIKKSDEEVYTKYESEEEFYIVNELEQETEYIVYVVAYDKSGNDRPTEEIKAETLSDKTYLYKTGNNCTELTGGWRFIQQANVETSENDEYIKIWATSSTYCVAALTTNNSIDLSEFSKIKFEMNDVRDFITYYPSYIGVSEQVESEWPTLTKELQIGNSNTKLIYEVDISDLEGEYYPVVKGAMKVYIYRIWLEK